MNAIENQFCANRGATKKVIVDQVHLL